VSCVCAATNHIATAEERELHRKTCQTLYIGEGTKGLVKWGTIGAVLLTGAHFLCTYASHNTRTLRSDPATHALYPSLEQGLASAPLTIASRSSPLVASARQALPSRPRRPVSCAPGTRRGCSTRARCQRPPLLRSRPPKPQPSSLARSLHSTPAVWPYSTHSTVSYHAPPPLHRAHRELNTRRL